jgi:anti-sigma B factor antagonist
MTQSRSHLKVRKANGVSLVEFADRKILEEISISEIQQELLNLVSTCPAIKLLLCFKNVEHLSSAALGMLITLNRKIEEQSGILRLSDITPQIYEVFKITRLNKLFQIHETSELAMSSFGE